MANYNNSTSNAGGNSVVSDEHPGYISGIEYCNDDIHTLSSFSMSQMTTAIIFQHYLYNGQPLDKFILEVTGKSSLVDPDIKLGIYTVFNGEPKERIYYDVRDILAVGNLEYDMSGENLDSGWYMIGTILTQSVNMRAVNNAVIRGLIANRYGFINNNNVLQAGLRYTQNSTLDLPLVFDINNYTRQTCSVIPTIKYVYQ